MVDKNMNSCRTACFNCEGDGMIEFVESNHKLCSQECFKKKLGEFTIPVCRSGQHMIPWKEIQSFLDRGNYKCKMCSKKIVITGASEHVCNGCKPRGDKPKCDGCKAEVKLDSIGCEHRFCVQCADKRKMNKECELHDFPCIQCSICSKICESRTLECGHVKCCKCFAEEENCSICIRCANCKKLVITILFNGRYLCKDCNPSVSPKQGCDFCSESMAEQLACSHSICKTCFSGLNDCPLCFTACHECHQKYAKNDLNLCGSCYSKQQVASLNLQCEYCSDHIAIYNLECSHKICKECIEQPCPVCSCADVSYTNKLPFCVSCHQNQGKATDSPSHYVCENCISTHSCSLCSTNALSTCAFCQVQGTFTEYCSSCAARFELQSYKCLICLESYPETGIITMQCGDTMCSPCLHSYIDSLISLSSIQDLKCPNLDCQQELSTDFLTRTLSNETIQKLNNQALSAGTETREKGV